MYAANAYKWKLEYWFSMMIAMAIKQTKRT